MVNSNQYNENEKNCIVNHLNENEKYSIIICSIYNNMKSNNSEIYDIKTDSLDSLILNKTERKKDIQKSWIEIIKINIQRSKKWNDK